MSFLNWHDVLLISQGPACEALRIRRPCPAGGCPYRRTLAPLQHDSGSRRVQQHSGYPPCSRVLILPLFQTTSIKVLFSASTHASTRVKARGLQQGVPAQPLVPESG